MTPKLQIFGSSGDGGSGAANLVLCTRQGTIESDICALISTTASGGVYRYAHDFGMEDRFFHFSGPYTAEGYRELTERTGATHTALSGYPRMVFGLDPRRVFNIHNGPKEFSGKGMHGDAVHAAVLAAFERKEIECTEIFMHFVTDDGQYDTGPVFFRHKIKIREGDTVDTLRERVKKNEHYWQPIMTNKVVTDLIRWDGVNRESLVGAVFNI